MRRVYHDPTPYVRIVDAVATAPCGPALVIAATETAPRKIRCTRFTAEIYEPVQLIEGELYEFLEATGEEVTVWHKFTDPMTTGSNLTLGLRPDGRWTTLVWECG